MFHKNRCLCRYALLLVGCVLSSAVAGQTTEGYVATGLFVPTGDDADVSDPSFALQLTADVQIVRQLAAEAELTWVPINLDSAQRSVGTLVEARQITALAGLRLSSNEISTASQRPSAYIAFRIGFSRIAVRSDTTTSVSGWIGRTVDATEHLPPFSFPIRATENGFVLSPRAGILLRPSPQSLIDLSFTPSFIFDGGEVTTQFIATIGFGLIGSLD
jgi:hypothetical protein